MYDAVSVAGKQLNFDVGESSGAEDNISVGRSIYRMEHDRALTDDEIGQSQLSSCTAQHSINKQIILWKEKTFESK